MTGDGIFYVLVGPSGAGKNTLMRRVKTFIPDLTQVPTMTTREMRDNEQEGREHRFVTPERFQQAIDHNELVEWQRVHNDDLYGTPRDVVETSVALGTDLIADIEFLGAEQLREAFPQHTVLIFVTPSDLRILAERIMQRGDIAPEELAGRLNRARFEMTFAPECEYLVINNVREAAAEALRRIVATERSKRRNQAIDPSEREPVHRIDATCTAIIQRGGELLLRDGALPQFRLDPRGARFDIATRDYLERTLGVPLEVTGPRDERFAYPAPSHVTVSGAAPYFSLNYYYRLLFPAAEHPVPPGWEWAPLASVQLPDMLSELVTP